MHIWKSIAHGPVHIEAFSRSLVTKVRGIDGSAADAWIGGTFVEQGEQEGSNVHGFLRSP